MKKRKINEICSSVARNSPLRFGATALGQQADMWLANARPNLPVANFTYPPNVGLIGRAKGHLDGVFKNGSQSFEKLFIVRRGFNGVLCLIQSHPIQVAGLHPCREK